MSGKGAEERLLRHVSQGLPRRGHLHAQPVRGRTVLHLCPPCGAHHEGLQGRPEDTEPYTGTGGKGRPVPERPHGECPGPAAGTDSLRHHPHITVRIPRPVLGTVRG